MKEALRDDSKQLRLKYQLICHAFIMLIYHITLMLLSCLWFLYFMLVYQVPLKFRYPFLAQIMWYAADKYVRLLERNNKELGLNPTPKADRNKQDTDTAKKKDAGVTPKGKHANKRSARSDVQEEGNEKTSASAQGENKEDDTTDTPGRRRSSRVARNEAIARQAQENAEKESAVKSGNKGKEEKEDTTELSRKKGTPKKQAKGNEAKVEVNGENHDEEGDNDKAVDSPETIEEGDKTPWRPVYLTRFEVDGLTTLIERLRTWPPAKRNVPSEVEDPDGLLEILEVCANLIQSNTWATCQL